MYHGNSVSISLLFLDVFWFGLVWFVAFFREGEGVVPRIFKILSCLINLKKFLGHSEHITLDPRSLGGHLGDCLPTSLTLIITFYAV